MELDEVLRRRRMTRTFAARPVEEAVLDNVLDVLAHLPSAGFSQGVEALVLTSDDARQRFWELASEAAWRAASPQAAGLVAAPVVIVPLVDPSVYLARYDEPDKATSGLAGRAAPSWDVPYWLVDAAFAVHGLLLAAESAGLGALFFRLRVAPDRVLAPFGVPDRFESIGALLLGWRDPSDVASGSPTRRQRRARTSLVHHDRF